jgi:hypothetical protein
MDHPDILGVEPYSLAGEQIKIDGAWYLIAPDGSYLFLSESDD